MKESKDGILTLFVIFILVGLAWQPVKDSQKNAKNNQHNNQQISPITSPPLIQTENQIKVDKTRSPYFDKVSMSYVSSLNNPNPSSEFISLYTNLEAGEKVNVTGWRLESERSGNSVKIGQASVLPYPNTKNYEDVVLKQGDIVYLVKGFSPVGISFRTNKCSGFFAEDRAFYPSLQRACPSPSKESLPRFSNNLDQDDECRTLIERIPACTTPATSINFTKLSDTLPQSCKDYLKTKINYNTCLATHFNDSDFALREWYVYLNIFGPLWRDKYEKITLYDNSGLVVSSFSY